MAVARQRWYRTEDHRVVPEGHPEAAFLLAAVGQPMPEGYTAPEADDALKVDAPVADKALSPEADKADGGIVINESTEEAVSSSGEDGEGGLTIRRRRR